jgi:hypothetical protein
VNLKGLPFKHGGPFHLGANHARDKVRDISKERRNGYQWHFANPQQALVRLQQWAKDHPETR